VEFRENIIIVVASAAVRHWQHLIRLRVVIFRRHPGLSAAAEYYRVPAECWRRVPAAGGSWEWRMRCTVGGQTASAWDAWVPPASHARARSRRWSIVTVVTADWTRCRRRGVQLAQETNLLPSHSDR